MPPRDVLEAELHEPRARPGTSADRGARVRDRRGTRTSRSPPRDRQKAKHRRRAHAETRQRRVDREARAVRRDRIVEDDVEHRLLPHQLRRGVERRGRRVRDGAVVARERAVRRQRDARRDDLAVAERRVVLVEMEVVGDPDSRRVAQERRRARDVEVAGAVERKVDVAHRLERRADRRRAACWPTGLTNTKTRTLAGMSCAKFTPGSASTSPDATAAATATFTP